MTPMANFSQSQRGMTVVFAVLLVSVVFAATFLLFNITLRQMLLSLVVRDSRFAFYAADSARNCALYWNWDWTYYPLPPEPGGQLRPFGFFVYDEPNNVHIFNKAEINSLSCNGYDIDVTSSGPTGPTPAEGGPTLTNPYKSIFTIFFSGQGTVSPCANVKVEKYFDALGKPNTDIQTDGYNVSDNNCQPQSARAVQRTVKSSY